MIIGVTNLKGGVGKTTIAQNLAVCFAHMGQKVCLVDTDTNQNSLAWSGVREETLPNIAVVGSVDPKAVSKTIQSMNSVYDIVVVDGTPSLSEMTTRILMACDMLIIPILPSANDFRAMTQFFERVEQAKEFKENIPLYFVMNQYNAKVNIYAASREAFKQYEVPILESTLGKRAIYAEAVFDGRGVIECTDMKAKEEFISFTNEVLEKAKELSLII